MIIWKQLEYSHCSRRSCRQKIYRRRVRQKRSVNGHMETGFYINYGLSRPILVQQESFQSDVLYLSNCYNARGVLSPIVSSSYLLINLENNDIYRGITSRFELSTGSVGLSHVQPGSGGLSCQKLR